MSGAVMTKREEIAEHTKRFEEEGGEVDLIPVYTKRKRRYLIKEKKSFFDQIVEESQKHWTLKDYFISNKTKYVLDQRGKFYRSPDFAHLGYGKLHTLVPSYKPDGCVFTYEMVCELDEIIIELSKLFGSEIDAMELHYRGMKGRHGFKKLTQEDIGILLDIPKSTVNSRISSGVCAVGGYLLRHFK